VNLGAGREIPIRELAECIADLTGFRGSNVWDTTKPDGQPCRHLDVSRAEKEFGFRATTDFVAGLRETIRWDRAQRAASSPAGLGRSAR
jgi:GDP-L-fucose synthase